MLLKGAANKIGRLCDFELKSVFVKAVGILLNLHDFSNFCLECLELLKAGMAI